MRIALLLSGQPRFVLEGAKYIIPNICEGNTVDTYAWLWHDPGLVNEPYKFGGDGGWEHQRIHEEAVTQVMQTYNPVCLKSEWSKKFINSSVPFEVPKNKYWGGGEPEDQEGFRNRTINNCLSYFYSLNQVNILKKEAEYKYDFKYDWVVRCRTDTFIHQKIPFADLNPELVHYSDNMHQPDGMINDWLDFGGSKQMDAFCSVFPVWELILDKCMRETEGAWCHELMHRKILDSFGVGIQPCNIHITLPRF